MYNYIYHQQSKYSNIDAVILIKIVIVNIFSQKNS
jgi:hypothetical protein